MHRYLVPAWIAKCLLPYSPLPSVVVQKQAHSIRYDGAVPIVQTFLTKIFQILTILFDHSLPVNLATALLNKKTLEVTHRQFKHLLQVTTAVKQTIAKA